MNAIQRMEQENNEILCSVKKVKRLFKDKKYKNSRSRKEYPVELYVSKQCGHLNRQVEGFLFIFRKLNKNWCRNFLNKWK